MIKKDFIKSSVIYTVSSTLSTFASFILLPFYTNTRLLTVPDYGALALYIGLSLFVQAIASFSLDFYVVVSYHDLKDKPEELKARIASLNGYFLTIAALLLIAFAAGGNFIINQYIDHPDPSSFRYMMMSVFTGIFNAHFRIYNNLLIQLGKPWRNFWANMLNFVSTIIITLVILYFYPLTLEGPIWGRFLSCLCIFILSFSFISYNYGIAFQSRFLKGAWQFCFPLMITAVFQWVLGYSDRYIIKPLLHNKEVAIFDLAVKFTLLVSFLLDGISSAMSPKLFSLLKEPTNEANLAEANKVYSSFNLVTLLLVPLNIFILPVFLPFFIHDPKYLHAFLYFGIVCAGFVLRSVQNIFIYPIHAYKKTHRFILVNGIAAVCQLVLGYIMVKYFKLYGAAVTLNIVKILLMFLFMYYCRDLIMMKFNQMKMIWLPLAVLFIICIPEFFIADYGLKMHAIHFAELLAIVILTCLVYKNEVISLMQWALARIKINKAV